MTRTCLTCGGRGWLRVFTIGGHAVPKHCPDCGDGKRDPQGFASSRHDLDDLKTQIRPSTIQHTAAD